MVNQPRTAWDPVVKSGRYSIGNPGEINLRTCGPETIERHALAIAPAKARAPLRDIHTSDDEDLSGCSLAYGIAYAPHAVLPLLTGLASYQRRTRHPRRDNPLYHIPFGRLLRLARTWAAELDRRAREQGTRTGFTDGEDGDPAPLCFDEPQ